MDAKLQVEKISFKIKNLNLLDDISLEIFKGETVGLIGPNGCGKSTLLKNIYRSLKPDAGVIYLNGQNIKEYKNRAFAKEMSVMVQENEIQFDVSVLDMVLYGRYAHQRFLEDTGKKDVEICRKWLKEVGLEGYEERSFLSLSGGEKQRTLLARALAQEAKMMILDEPTNHLDICHQYRLMEVLKQQPITVFTSIHDLNIAALYCDRILLMEAGEIIQSGSPKDILTRENIQKSFHIDSEISLDPITHKPRIYYLPPNQ